MTERLTPTNAFGRFPGSNAGLPTGTPAERGETGYLIVAGTAPDDTHALIAREPDGTARLSDTTVERIAQRVVELLRD